MKCYCDDEGRETFERGLFLVFSWIFFFGIGFCVGMYSKKDNNTCPVENTTKIDSLITVNDSIKIKVEKLDSIKDAKIIEVSTLNNDSTLKLFYELVSE